MNLTGAFLCARAAFAMMRTQEPGGGRIVNNGLISAHAPRPGSIAYTATKHVGARQADGTLRPEPTFDATHVADAVR